MEKFDEGENFKPDYLKKIEKLANPFKGTAIDKMLETQKRFEQVVNPFKGSNMENIMNSEKITRGLNPTTSLMNHRIKEIERAMEKTNFLANHEKMLGASAGAHLMMKSLQGYTTHGKSWADFLSQSIKTKTLKNNPLFTPRNLALVHNYVKLYEEYENDLEQDAEAKESKNRIITLDDTIRVQKLIKSVYDDNQEIYRVNPFDFEEMIAELLRNKGFLVDLTKKTRDGGKDIIALHDTKGLGVNKYLIECKRYRADRPVDVNIVKSFCYTVIRQEKANKGILFTSSYFSKDAHKIKASEKSIIDFKDGVEILDWISEYLKIE